MRQRGWFRHENRNLRHQTVRTPPNGKEPQVPRRCGTPGCGLSGDQVAPGGEPPGHLQSALPGQRTVSCSPSHRGRDAPPLVGHWRGLLWERGQCLCHRMRLAAPGPTPFSRPSSPCRWSAFPEAPELPYPAEGCWDHRTESLERQRRSSTTGAGEAIPLAVYGSRRLRGLLPRARHALEEIFHFPVEMAHLEVDLGHGGPHPAGSTALESVVDSPDT